MCNVIISSDDAALSGTGVVPDTRFAICWGTRPANLWFSAGTGHNSNDGEWQKSFRGNFQW